MRRISQRSTIYIQWLLSAAHLFPGATYFFTINIYQRQRVLTGLPFPSFYRLEEERAVYPLYWAGTESPIHPMVTLYGEPG